MFERLHSGGELSDDDLDQVAGGAVDYEGLWAYYINPLDGTIEEGGTDTELQNRLKGRGRSL